MLTVCDVSAIQPGDLYCSDWPGLKQILKLQREVREGDRVTSTVSYAITSVPPGAYTAAQWLQIWRNHWGIENRCHWVLDVNYREDACLIRRDHGPHNMATLRRIAQNQIKLDASKGSQKTKRKRMGWSDDYLQGLFGLTLGSVSHAQISSEG